MKITVTSVLVDDQSKALRFYTEVLGDRLSGQAEAVVGGEPGAQLEERLPVTAGQLVQDRSAGGIGQRLEDVTHGVTIGKCPLACQRMGGSW